MGSHRPYWDPIEVACKNVLGSFKTDDVSRVVLFGEAGIGKTWMARKTSEYATKDSSCHVVLWLNLNKELDEMSLYENIASQLSVFPKKKEDDKDDSYEDDSEDEEEHKYRDFMMLKYQIHEELRRKRKEKKYPLLVLDDAESVTSEERVMKDLCLLDFLAPYRPLKILVTRRKGEENVVNSDAEVESNSLVVSYGEIKYRGKEKLRASLGFNTIDVSQILSDTFTDDYLVILLEFLIKDGSRKSFEKACGEDAGVLKRRIVEMSMRLPAAVVVLAKSLNCIAQKTAVDFLSSFPPDTADCGRATTGTPRRNPILDLAYELLKTDNAMKSSIVDCFWHSLSFFEHCGCVNYQELIVHWIIEGYFDPIRSITKAYKEGHAILMELINRGILKIQEDNVVMPEVAMKNLNDFQLRGLFGTSRIGLAKLCGSGMTKGLGKTNHVDDIIEAVRATRKGENISTVLVSGNRLRRETPENFFEKRKDLEILGLFKSTVDHFVPSLVKLEKLRVLVIRDCGLLKEIEELKALQGLHALEVSGASSLKEISDEFFTVMPDLQSLHLSRLQIKSSPSSISQLRKLNRLIIRDCAALEDLPDIQELEMLEIVDISGARGLKISYDNSEGDKRNRNFYHLTKLQLLDFSDSQIERLPMFQDSGVAARLHSLTQILLRNCSKLIKLPNLKPLSGLRILDLSGTTGLVKIREVCFEDKKELQTLNLSRTNLSELATTIEELSSLSELLLRDCTNLGILPNINKLTNLEVIDVSGCKKLHTIEGSFEDMSYLREVNLSGTKVETPELPKESKNRRVKNIRLANKKHFEGEKWSQIKEDIEHWRSTSKDWSEVRKPMSSEISEIPTSSDAVYKSREISEKDFEEITEISASDYYTKKKNDNKVAMQSFMESSKLSKFPREIISRLEVINRQIQSNKPHADSTEKEDVSKDVIKRHKSENEQALTQFYCPSPELNLEYDSILLQDMNHPEVYLKENDDKLCKEIVEVLGRDGPQRVLLAGEAGIGKTRLAKMVGEHVIDNKLCFLTLRLHLNKKFEGEQSLYENIASQLCVYSDFEETEVDDRDEDEEDEKKPEALLDELKKKIIEEIKKKLPTEGEKKYLLLILDDEGNKTTEEMVMKDLNLDEFLKHQICQNPKFRDSGSKDHPPLKIIITRRKGEEDATELEPDTDSEQEDDNKSESKTESEAGEISVDEDNKSESKTESEAGEIESVDEDNERESEAQATESAQNTKHDGESEASTAAESKVDTKSSDTIDLIDVSKGLLDSINELYLRNLLASLIPGEWKTAKLICDIVEKSKNSPAAIVVLAKSLKRIMQSTHYLEKEKLKEKINEKMKEVLSADRSESAINQIMYLAYELLETYDLSSKDAMLDCFWHSLDFFEHCGCVYYRDLITQWILEGYFDPVRSVEKAYQEGHSILMELINRGMLKIQENNVVVPEMAMISLIDPRRRGHLGRSRLGFSRVYGGDKKKGIGKITQLDDMIKTVQAKKGDKITTILVSGDRLRRVTPKKFFAKLDDLEVLGFFEPTLEPFVPSFLNLLKLRVLVIRDCDLLDDIEKLKAFTKLNALEVSGASSLKKISNEFFKALPKLQSLHLSGLQITSSPSSISELKELHCLIIRDCPLLEDLPDMQELVKLEVVDISGARGLQPSFKNTEGDKRNKNFYHLTQLQLLDFSESQIERLPIFQDSTVAAKLHSLTRLLLRNCSRLRRLPSLKPLSGLQILDLSGTTSLVKIQEVCFEDKKELKILDLSRTNLSELATTIEELSSLNKLLLRDCINLDAIPNIKKLTNLEVIDVSGSTKLEKIDGSFEEMSFLREVNLYGTKVETPKLPKESKIHCVKRITLADGKHFEGKDWSEVRGKMSNVISANPSSSGAVYKSREIYEETGEIQSDEPWVSDLTEMGDASKERLLQVRIGRALYKKTLLSFVGSETPKKVVEINETSNIDEDALANAESVSFVDCSSKRLTSVFNKTKSLKRCWLRMCIDIKDLFSGVNEEPLKSLETLSITNLPSLEMISSVGNFENLKNLSLDCCPKIKTIFPEMPSSLIVLNVKHCEKLEKVVEGVQLSSLTNLKKLSMDSCPNIKTIFPEMPSSLEVLHVRHCEKLEKVVEGVKLSSHSNLKKLSMDSCPKIKTIFPEMPSSLEVLNVKHCEKLEKVVEGVELSALSNLTWKAENCPKFEGNSKDSDYVMVEHTDASPDSPPQELRSYKWLD